MRLRSTLLVLVFAAIGCGADASHRCPCRASASAAHPRVTSTRATESPAAPAVDLSDVPLEGAPADAPITVRRARFPRGSSMRIDDTTRAETIVVVLEGALEASPRLGGGHDAPVPLGPGSALRVPPGTTAGAVRASAPAGANALIISVRCGPGAPCAAAAADTARGQVGGLDSTPLLVVGGGHVRVRILFPLVASETTALSLERFEADSGASVPSHVHETSAEILVVDSGTGTMHLGNREIAVRPGMGIYVPPNTPHDFTCTEALSAWQLYGPSGPEMRFRAAAR